MHPPTERRRPDPDTDGHAELQKTDHVPGRQVEGPRLLRVLLRQGVWQVEADKEDHRGIDSREGEAEYCELLVLAGGFLMSNVN